MEKLSARSERILVDSGDSPQEASDPSLSSQDPQRELTPWGKVSSIYETDRNRLVGFAASKGLTHEGAEDAVQNALLELWVHKERLRDENLRSYTVATIASRSHDLRRYENRRSTVTLEPYEEFADKTEPYEFAEGNMITKQVMEVLDQLSDEHREVLEAKFLNDLSHSEIVENLGIKSGTAKSRLSRARTSFREKYAEFDPSVVELKATLIYTADGSADDPQR